MYTLELDLHIHFNPPMGETGAGIVLTRTLQVPFVPSTKIRLFAAGMDDCPMPEGMMIKDLAWDMDRGIFLGDTYLIDSGVPFPMVPKVVAGWIEKGWRLGSYRDAYDDGSQDGPSAPGVTLISDPSDDEWGQAEDAHLKSWRERRRDANEVMRALIRFMVESYQDEPAAYAFDQTGRYYDDYDFQRGKEKDPLIKESSEIALAYGKLTGEEKDQWRDRVIAKYPTLESLIKRLVRRQKRAAAAAATKADAARSSRRGRSRA